MELKQGNIIIREMRYDDLSQVKYIRDASLEFLDTQVSFSLEETQNWFNTQNPEWYVIEIRDRVAGYIRTSNHDRVNKNLYIGENQIILISAITIFKFLFRNSSFLA